VTHVLIAVAVGAFVGAWVGIALAAMRIEFELD
jgi:hypothetical protein